MYREIVVPVDDQHGFDALPTAVELSRVAGAQLTVLGVVRDESHAEERRALVARHIEGLDRARAETVIVHHKDAAKAILAHAQSSDQVICMAVGGPHHLTDPVLGGVTERVVNHSPHPVVVVGRHCAPERRSDIKRLIVALDGTPPGDHALDVAALWASAFGVALMLVEVLKVNVHTSRAIDASGHGGGTGEHNYLMARARDIQRRGLDVSWEVLHDVPARRHHHHPAHAVIDYAASVAGSMLVIATTGREGLRLAISGSTTHYLIAHSPVPVLVTHRGHPEELPAEVFLTGASEHN